MFVLLVCWIVLNSIETGRLVLCIMLTQQVGWHAGLVCSEFTRVQSPIVAPPRHHEAITEMLTKRHGRKMEVSPFTVEQMKKKLEKFMTTRSRHLRIRSDEFRPLNCSSLQFPKKKMLKFSPKSGVLKSWF